MQRRNFVKQSIAGAIVAATALALTGLVRADGGGGNTTTSKESTDFWNSTTDLMSTTEAASGYRCKLDEDWLKGGEFNKSWFFDGATEADDDDYIAFNHPGECLILQPRLFDNNAEWHSYCLHICISKDGDEPKKIFKKCNSYTPPASGHVEFDWRTPQDDDQQFEHENGKAPDLSFGKPKGTGQNTPLKICIFLYQRQEIRQYLFHQS